MYNSDGQVEKIVRHADGLWRVVYGDGVDLRKEDDDIQSRNSDEEPVQEAVEEVAEVAVKKKKNRKKKRKKKYRQWS